MVGLVLVSHSKNLANSVKELVLQMTAADFPVAVASGAGEKHEELGTDAVHIAEVLGALIRAEGVLVLMDLGSAVLSAQTALELLNLPSNAEVELCAAPFVEGAVAAAVQSFAGGSLQQVAAEAKRGLAAKQQQLEPLAQEIPTPNARSASGPSAELILIVKNEHGLHARPAARFVRTASAFASTIEVFNLTGRRGPASARSLTSIALLQVHRGDRIRIVATGGDREAGLEALHALALQGFGEEVGAGSQAPPAPSSNPAGLASGPSPSGVPASDGIAIGPLLPLENILYQPDDGSPHDPVTELEKLRGAVAHVRETAQIRSSETIPPGGPAGAEIMEAQSLILIDPVLHEKVRTEIEEKHVSASRAWLDVTEHLATQYQTMDDAYLRERASDVRDIARRVLRVLSGNGSPPSIQPETPSILFTGELLPSEAAVCDPAKVLGVITRDGSASSHSAILLRTLGIPMVAGVRWLDESQASGKTVAIDGNTGEVWVEPDAHTVERLQHRQATLCEQQGIVVAMKSQPSITVDGVRIQVLANVASVADASAAVAGGAEGFGLLRTEFLFLTRREAPSEEEQTDSLREILNLTSGPVSVRTFDGGADKPLPYLPQIQEANPFLGLRGIRLSLKYEELFKVHLRAILSAGAGHDLWVMFPMISVMDEVERGRRLLEDTHAELEQKRQSHAWPVKIGIMIEVPSAALMSEQLANDLDFVSIGTNDLTQYVMAAERGNAFVADLQDSLHPAVLRLMQTVVKGAPTGGCHVSVCGDAASDPVSAAVFAGLGIRSLSVRPTQVAETKALFRKLREADLKQLAERALGCSNASQVKRLVNDYLKSAHITDPVSSAHATL